MIFFNNLMEIENRNTKFNFASLNIQTMTTGISINYYIAYKQIDPRKTATIDSKLIKYNILLYSKYRKKKITLYPGLSK